MSLTLKLTGFRLRTELQRTPVADPGFSRGRQPLGLVLKPQTIIWQNFCSKMHGNERNCTEREYASLVFPFGSTKEHPATILAAISFASFLSLKTRSRVQIYLSFTKYELIFQLEFMNDFEEMY